MAPHICIDTDGAFFFPPFLLSYIIPPRCAASTPYLATSFVLSCLSPPLTVRGWHWNSYGLNGRYSPTSCDTMPHHMCKLACFFGQVRSDSAYMRSHQLTHLPLSPSSCLRFSFLRAGQTSSPPYSDFQVIMYVPASSPSMCTYIYIQIGRAHV